ncbi:Protein CHROMATIN REMODELING 19 [Striga hermonthica]|uniref:Protein CHROMATIN REMODELING 19 n=1 Tax=Striga hermonthica TaxID=68872 RepID=A0A9N7R2A2_STRHE|nr:Protein CHROMATIN REMODELING 19 [Striga hermonthica]
MKRDRDFIELSDGEWSPHSDSFKPSRVINPKPTPQSPPPPIESFAYSKTKVHIIESSSSEELGNTAAGNDLEDLEDADVGVSTTGGRASRGKRFVIEDDDEDEEKEEGGGAGHEGEDLEVWLSEEEELEEEEDVVKKALLKCETISAELKRELYGTSTAACERYSEVELSSSAVRIVTQDDVNDACGAGDSEPMLKPYQLIGVNFLLLLYRKKIGGAILADEMGLGKTVQAITYLILLKHLEDDPGPHLIVCPASVLENWERELKKWCPTLSVLQYHGSARSAYSKELSSLGKAGLPPPFDVILVCYSLFERHSVQQKDDRKILRHWKWSCVIMDEAHALKDKSSYRWKNLMSIAKNARQRLMLTGTPLQNDLHELWSMLEFMMPDIFETGDVDLKKLLNAEDSDLVGRMKSILGPFILRRLKSDVMQQLVPKMQKIEYVRMGKEQQDAYKEAIENYRASSQARIMKSSENCLNDVARILPRRQISNYFLEFRKIANHPLLVRRIYSDDDVVRFAKMLHPKGVFGFECTLERVIEELKSYNDFSIHRLLLYYGDTGMRGILSDEHVMISAKCQVLAELLPKLNRCGSRVLIFSQWTSMLDILEWTLDVIGVTYRRLDGSTQVTERQTIVDTFNKDTSIFACLLSTRAGGQGLNLTGADTVIIHDMDFNPQIDRQAEDRCHRIGQTRPVTIYRLVTKDTVDENVYEIAKRKLNLDAAVLKSGVEVENDAKTKLRQRRSRLAVNHLCRRPPPYYRPATLSTSAPVTLRRAKPCFCRLSLPPSRCKLPRRSPPSPRQSLGTPIRSPPAMAPPTMAPRQTY